ncbi:serine/threonine protein kinase, partial [Bacillus wiedmannii]|nr:serine/threonine protein kinase [Bacillus wiedmannii]
MSNTEIYNLIIINVRYIMKDIPVEIQLNQVTFQLKEHHNFDWLMKLGT